MRLVQKMIEPMLHTNRWYRDFDSVKLLQAERTIPAGPTGRGFSQLLQAIVRKEVIQQETRCYGIGHGYARQESVRTNPTLVIRLRDGDRALPREHNIEYEVARFDTKELLRADLGSVQRGFVKCSPSERTPSSG